MLKRALAIFLSSIVWFSWLIPWNRFPDPDAFYHAKMSLLLWQHGPIYTFPWLDLTTLGKAFDDQHFLFHAIEAPFVGLLGWATGARVTDVLLSAVFITVCFICFRLLGIRRSLAWTALLAATSPLIMRLLLGKASPLALTLFVLGLTFVWKRKLIGAFIIGALFALSHGGWAFLLGAAGFLAMGDVLHAHIVDRQSWRDAIVGSPWKELIACSLGILLGLIIHPNFPANISVLWIQVVKIGIATPYGHVPLGREWFPSSIFDLAASFAPWAIALILGMAGVFLAAKRPIDRDAARAATSFAWPVAAFVALTLKSRRNAEYLAPALALWIPWLWNMIDVTAFRRVLAMGWSKMRSRVTFVLLAILVFAVLGKGIWDARTALRLTASSDDVFREAMAPISAAARPGDRVFHSDWDEFPMLFNIDDRLRYVSGLDPTFLYEASTTLSDAYRDLTWRTASATHATAWTLIHDRLDAKFIMIAKSDHAALADLLETDPRYRLLAETDDAVTFSVQP